METVELGVKVRNERGSRAARNLRRNGSVPAILYGHGMTPLSLEVNTRELYQVLHTRAGENVIIQLKAEGADLQESTCVVRDIQHNPITDAIEHIDFNIISLTEKIEVRVPIVIKNEENTIGVKAGGVMDVVHHEIQVICLPTEIPEAITVDVKDLKIGDAVHVRELSIPHGVEVDYREIGEDEVVITVHPPRLEEAPVETEAGAQPEVIEKGKKVAEGEEEAVAKPQAAGAKPPAPGGKPPK